MYIFQNPSALGGGCRPQNPLQERRRANKLDLHPEKVLTISLNDHFEGVCRWSFKISEEFRAPRSITPKFLSNFRFSMWFWLKSDGVLKATLHIWLIYEVCHANLKCLFAFFVNFSNFARARGPPPTPPPPQKRLTSGNHGNERNNVFVCIPPACFELSPPLKKSCTNPDERLNEVICSTLKGG